jgi:hypothetical protein
VRPTAPLAGPASAQFSGAVIDELLRALIAQVADLVELRSGPGLVVRMQFDLDGTPVRLP